MYAGDMLNAEAGEFVPYSKFGHDVSAMLASCKVFPFSCFSFLVSLFFSLSPCDRRACLLPGTLPPPYPFSSSSVWCQSRGPISVSLCILVLALALMHALSEANAQKHATVSGVNAGWR